MDANAKATSRRGCAKISVMLTCGSVAFYVILVSFEEHYYLYLCLPFAALSTSLLLELTASSSFAERCTQAGG